MEGVCGTDIRSVALPEAAHPAHALAESHEQSEEDRRHRAFPAQSTLPADHSDPGAHLSTSALVSNLSLTQAPAFTRSMHIDADESRG